MAEPNEVPDDSPAVNNRGQVLNCFSLSQQDDEDEGLQFSRSAGTTWV